MNVADNTAVDALLSEIPDTLQEAVVPVDSVASASPRREFSQMMRKIPVTLTLEVGSARISLQQLASTGPNSVIELDTLAGEPLVIKVNGTPIGRAEVVVSGENYGLKVLELSDLDLGTLSR